MSSPWFLTKLLTPRTWLACVLFAAFNPGARAADELTLLRTAVDKWSNERNSWAFTQRVREFDGEGRSRTRVERFDLSRGELHRWTLLSIDGRAPTEKETAAFEKRKNRKRKQNPKPPAAYVDFERVVVLATHPDWVRYAVPLREDISRLVPLEDITVIVTVDRAREMVRHLAITLEDPMRIALGLARVTDLTFDLDFELVDRGRADQPAGAQPSGTAEAAVSRFGKRAEFSWSEFTRVIPPEDDAPAHADDAANGTDSGKASTP